MEHLLSTEILDGSGSVHSRYLCLLICVFALFQLSLLVQLSRDSTFLHAISFGSQSLSILYKIPYLNFSILLLTCIAYLCHFVASLCHSFKNVCMKWIQRILQMKFVIFLEEIECVKEHKTLVLKLFLCLSFHILYKWQFSVNHDWI